MRILFVIVIIAIALVAAATLYFFFNSNPSSSQTPSPQQKSTKPTLPEPNPLWTPVLGYTNSFNQCRALCKNYQQSCSNQTALSYCSAIVSLDLNKNGKINAGEVGKSPAGTSNCETNARCYDVIPTCGCANKPLTISSCIALFYQNYLSAGLNDTEALQQITQNTASNCHPPQT